jgi:hypothetical protein
MSMVAWLGMEGAVGSEKCLLVPHIPVKASQLFVVVWRRSGRVCEEELCT